MNINLILNNKTRNIKNIIIDFNKKIEEFKYLISPDIEKYNSRLRKSFFILIYLFIGLAAFYIFSLIATHNPNFDYVIETGERVIILIATITILTFTYALALEYPKKEVVLNSGKYFFKSVLYFIISIILLIGLRDNFENQSNTLGLPEFIFDFQIIFELILFLIGFVILLISAYFFAKGIRDLLESL